jgi:NAD(P)-dependent dehydrogenase (short-subunit alcohol dehydrogenase family)
MQNFQGRVAVVTGAASGFGLEVSKLAAQRGMRVVMADVQSEALEQAGRTVAELGAEVLTQRVDVSKAAEVEALADAAERRFGVPHFVFNNAGVATGGLIWETTAKQWEWVLGVNLFGVAHGVRVFTPRMLAAERSDPTYEGHITNTASMAGLLNSPNLGVYNVSKHAVVSLSETLYHDLSLVSERVHASVLCPYFVPTGIHQSDRVRPAELRDESAAPTASQRIAQANNDRAVTRGKVSASQVAALVFDAISARRFYVYTHPQALGMVQRRLEDVLHGTNPTDPFFERPELGQALRDALRAR